MMIVRRAGALFVCVLLAGTVACSDAGAGAGIGTASGFNVIRYPAAEREPAPRIEGPRLQDGRPVTPADVAGKVVVLNFWGSWCGPCRKEQPLLEALSREYAARGVAFIGVNTRRDQRAAALAFLEEFSVTYPSIYDPDSTLAFRFGVRVMPATLVLDARGRIAARIVGAIRNEADLRLVLDEESAS